MKPDKILQFSTFPEHLPDICALSHHTCIVNDLEYFMRFSSSTPKDDTGQIMITFWLYSPNSDPTWPIIRVVNDTISDIIYYDSNKQPISEPEYLEFRPYPVAEFNDYIKHNIGGFILRDFKESDILSNLNL